MKTYDKKKDDIEFEKMLKSVVEMTHAIVEVNAVLDNAIDKLNALEESAKTEIEDEDYRDNVLKLLDEHRKAVNNSWGLMIRVGEADVKCLKGLKEIE